MSKYINPYSSAVDLYNEVEPTSPYRKVAALAIVAMLGSLELYLLKLISKQHTVGMDVKKGLGQTLQLLNKNTNTILSRLLSLGLIVEITVDSDKKRRFDLTPMGHTVKNCNESDLDAHLNWYVDFKNETKGSS